MKRLIVLAVFVVLSSASPAIASELFPFVISFDAPNNITNISHHLDAPAGKDGFVRVVDGHFVTDKGRIKFWGTNTCFAANFHDKATADRVADRLARFGTNCVRLHHLDMYDIWGGSNAKTKMTMDPAQLDRLDYFVAALKKRGIYVNLNLHVSRLLDERDGFPGPANRTSFDKGIDNYYRPIIDANKKFAKDILEHVNPYTGNAYKDEPAVAMIEINNENSVICVWGAWGNLHQIGGPFLAEFRKQWNDWLIAKYTDDASLRKAWNARNEPLGSEMLKNGNFSDGYIPGREGWNWETNGTTDAPIANVNGTLRMEVKRKGNVAWHPQFVGSGFAVKKDQLYTLEFRAKADKAVSLSVGVRMNHEPWEGLGFDTTVTLSHDWKIFRLTLVPNRDDDNARVTLGNFQEGNVYEFDFVSLKPGGTVGLPLEDFSDKESSLAARTVPVIWKKDAGQFPKEAVADFCDFLFDIEAKYWDEMYRFLKEEIKVKQPVSGTQLEYGSTIAQAKMDYCDIHAYWNHPVFPRREWDQNDWYIRNRALVHSLDREILPQLASKRVWGKPFTVSEYNHPFPNSYAAEGFPILAAFGAFQDWDGIFPFAYSHSREAEPQRITSFFDTAGNTVQTAHMIACKVLFDAKIDAPAIIAPLTAAKEREIYKKDLHQYNIGFAGLGLNPALALAHRVAVDVSGKVTEMPEVPNLDMPNCFLKPDHWFIPLGGDGTIPWGDEMQNNDGAIKGGTGLFEKNEFGAHVSVTTPRAGLFTGFVDDKHMYIIQPGALVFTEKPNLGWATATLTRLDDNKEGEPMRYLFVITGETRNTDMQFESLGGDRVTFGNRWGRAPVLCEGVAVKLFWHDRRSDNIRCWALDESGNRRQEVPVTRDERHPIIATKPDYKTIWYEIEVAR